MKPLRAPIRFSERSARGAFTLLEIIIACAVFFLVAFSILELVTRGLASARALQERDPDPGMLAAELSTTNILIEGSESGDFEDMYPGLFPGFHWTRDVVEVASNRLFQVDFTVFRASRKGPSVVKLSVLRFAPESPPGSASSAF